MRKNAHLGKENTITGFTFRLAHVYFGLEILSKSTVMGEQGRPGLPWHELSELQSTIFRKLPLYWNKELKFEPAA